MYLSTVTKYLYSNTSHLWRDGNEEERKDAWRKECAENISGLKESEMAPLRERTRKPSRPLEN